MPDRDVLDRLYNDIGEALDGLRRWFPTHRLTFLARCTRTDLEDADVLLTDDSLSEILSAVQRRANADDEDPDA